MASIGKNFWQSLYVQLIKMGKYQEAVQLIMERLPLPGVLGRVCPHPCESKCRRAELDEPVSICSLKRFAADQVDLGSFAPPLVEARPEKIAVVGSGPAGLSCAYHLALKGYRPTIFEALPQAGGMLRVGIPDYRLPKSVLDQEIDNVLRLGVELKTNTALGRDFTLDGLFDEGYKAVFLGIGCHVGKPLGVANESAPGVVQGVDLLRRHNLGESPEIGKSLAVIGGGNVAIDVACTARRLGSDVTIVYRRSREEMPAFAHEVEQAEIQDEIFEAVVLSVGMVIPPDIVKLAENLQVPLSPNNFVEASCFEPTTTFREGIFSCGAFNGPKDIPQSVMEGSAAAAAATRALAEARGTMLKQKVFPPEKDLTGRPPRVGVFVCNCGLNIGGVADVPAIVEYAQGIGDVAYAQANLFTCSQDSQAQMVEMIKEHDLNRVVVAACSPSTHAAINPNVLLSLDLDQEIADKSERLKQAKAVAFIQCVGSRSPERPYCNKVCCAHSVENAIKLKVMNPEMDVYILYRDMRTYGEREVLYEKAREMGIVFIRYRRLQPPVVEEAGGRLRITVKDQILERPVSFSVDLLTLATTIIPHQNAPLAELYKIPLNAEGFFNEAHAKTKPVEASTEGIFMAGLCHYPKPLQESAAEALACASRANTILSRDFLQLESIISNPIDENCDGCAFCVDACPFKSIALIEYMKDGGVKKTVEVNAIQCKGCGSCMATCPKQGIYVAGFMPEQLAAQVEAALGLI